jgi:hypothetical protein
MSDDFGVRRCISELNLWIRSYKNEKEKCPLSVDEDLNSSRARSSNSEKSCRPSIFRGQILHAEKLDILPGRHLFILVIIVCKEFQGLIRVFFADFALYSAQIVASGAPFSSLSVRGDISIRSHFN